MKDFISITVNAVIFVCITLLAFAFIHTMLSGLGSLLSPSTFVECFQSSLYMFSVVVLLVTFFGNAVCSDENDKS